MKPLCTTIRRSLVAISLGLVAICASADPRLEGTGHLRLVNDLDRPQDGYCLDLMGSGDQVRLDMPLTAHNCKPGLYHDEAVRLEPTGHIHFPTYNACATVAGLNGKPLPGVAVMPRRCNEQSAFLNAGPLQMFTFHEDGKVELNGSGLCLAVGGRSESTFDATHRYRALFMADCASADPKLSRWRFTDPRR